MNKIIYKDGSSEILSDEEFEKFPSEMESEIASVSLVESPTDMRNRAKQEFQQDTQQQKFDERRAGLTELFPNLVRSSDNGEGLLKNILAGSMDVAATPGRTLTSYMLPNEERMQDYQQEYPRLSKVTEVAKEITESPSTLLLAGLGKVPSVLGRIGLGTGIVLGEDLAEKGQLQADIPTAIGLASNILPELKAVRPFLGNLANQARKAEKVGDVLAALELKRGAGVHSVLPDNVDSRTVEEIFSVAYPEKYAEYLKNKQILDKFNKVSETMQGTTGNILGGVLGGGLGSMGGPIGSMAGAGLGGYITPKLTKAIMPLLDTPKLIRGLHSVDEGLKFIPKNTGEVVRVTGSVVPDAVQTSDIKVKQMQLNTQKKNAMSLLEQAAADNKLTETLYRGWKKKLEENPSAIEEFRRTFY